MKETAEVGSWDTRESDSTYYAQHGEDYLLSRLFAERQSGVCVEVGAYDGITNSNTLHFEEKGWECVLVEANPQLSERIQRRRKAKLFKCAVSDTVGFLYLLVGRGVEDLATVERTTPRVKRIHSATSDLMTIKVPSLTLDLVLAAAGIKNIDFITVDVEGHEEAALRGFDLEHWHPKIVIVENNDHIERKEIAGLMKRSGYIRVYRTGCNDWYCHQQDAEFGSFTRIWRRMGSPRDYSAFRSACFVLTPPWILARILQLKRWAQRALGI